MFGKEARPLFEEAESLLEANPNSEPPSRGEEVARVKLLQIGRWL